MVLHAGSPRICEQELQTDVEMSTLKRVEVTRYQKSRACTAIYQIKMPL